MQVSVVRHGLCDPTSGWRSEKGSARTFEYLFLDATFSVRLVRHSSACGHKILSSVRREEKEGTDGLV